MPRGRRSVNRPEIVARIIRILSTGKGVAQASAEAGLDASTWHRWCRSDRGLRLEAARTIILAALQAGLKEATAVARGGIDMKTWAAIQRTDKDTRDRAIAFIGERMAYYEYRLREIASQDRNLPAALTATIFALKEGGWVEAQHKPAEISKEVQPLLLVSDLGEIRARERTNLEADRLMVEAALNVKKHAEEHGNGGGNGDSVP